jgi:hypothetical protein
MVTKKIIKKSIKIKHCIINFNDFLKGLSINNGNNERSLSILLQMIRLIKTLKKELNELKSSPKTTKEDKEMIKHIEKEIKTDIIMPSPDLIQKYKELEFIVNYYKNNF